MQKSLSFNEKLGFKKRPVGFSTKAIHSGQGSDQWKSRAVVPPVLTSTTFQHLGPDEHYGYQYGRYKNPTREVLDNCLASIDNAKFALTFSAGVGAITSIISTLQSGDGIISTQNLYGGTIRLFRDFGAKMGIETQYVDFDNLKTLEAALKANTKIVWIETPTNPLLTILDIKAIADVVHAKSKALLIVDNTFLTPYFQQPLDLGADVVMYSLSKFMNGHSDVIMGAITTNDEKFYETLKYFQISTGSVPSPRDCYEVNRSLKTLPVRMERHSENTYEIAKFLDSHSKIEKVFHPALKSHKNHEVALKQSYGHSGIMSFYIKGSFKQSKKFFKSLKLILVAESLGGVETTVSFPWMMSHSDLPEEQRIHIGVTDTLIRISIGLEDVTELIADLEEALSQI